MTAYEALAQRELAPLLELADGRACTPELWPTRRAELLTLLSEHIYGYTPPAPPEVRAEILSTDPLACAGKVRHERILLSFATPRGEYSFPCDLFVPHMDQPAATFLQLAFRSDLPDRYTPVEEITDQGFALVNLCYQDVTPDSKFGDYSSGLAAHYIGEQQRDATTWGKIGIWAYGASRVLDYLQTRSDLAPEQVAILGHSRLGKTALWCAAQDTRFPLAVANNSGFGGAALAKGGSGERVADFLRAGSYDWFCERFQTYVGQEDRLPYDQDQLLALIAPRWLAVGSAQLDQAADPASEFLACVSASEAYQLLGVPGLVLEDVVMPPLPPSHYAEGRISYHLRSGTHYLSRYDWQRYMSFFRAKLDASP